jgi:signal transduction histidine kinase
VAILATGKDIRIEVDCPAGLELVCDRRMVETVLRNLLSNAIKFIAPGGLRCRWLRPGPDRGSPYE